MLDTTIVAALLAGAAAISCLAFASGEFREMARVTLFGSKNRGPKGTNFMPERDIPSMMRKVVLITGASGDLGRQTAVELARHGRPKRIYVADLPRDEDLKRSIIERIGRDAYGEDHRKGEEQKGETEVRFLDLDLTCFDSIKACAAEFLRKEERLDVLILNAGIIRVAAGKTRQGIETHFGLNYLGHALLAKLLVPTLVRTVQEHLSTDARVVVVSSEGHAMAPKGGILFERLKSNCADLGYAQRYGQSKLALIHLTRDLAREHPDLTTAAVHPGRILTGMATSLQSESLLVRATKPIAPYFCVPVSVGILNHLWAATSPDVVSGQYYEPVGVSGKESKLAKDEELRRRLQEWTNEELKYALA